MALVGYFVVFFVNVLFRSHAVTRQFLPREAIRVARYCQGKLSVRPSVSLSVTLRYRDHIGWSSAKIISRLISLTMSLSADPNMTDLLQREHPQTMSEIQGH